MKRRFALPTDHSYEWRRWYTPSEKASMRRDIRRWRHGTPAERHAADLLEDELGVSPGFERTDPHYREQRAYNRLGDMALIMATLIVAVITLAVLMAAGVVQ